MTSDGDEPGADGGPGGHSVFAAAFLDALLRMQGKFTVQELFANRIQLQIAGSSGQKPELNQLSLAGDKGGTFIFEKR